MEFTCEYVLIDIDIDKDVIMQKSKATFYKAFLKMGTYTNKNCNIATGLWISIKESAFCRVGTAALMYPRS